MSYKCKCGCKHESVKYCRKCHMVYCLDCPKSWKDRKAYLAARAKKQKDMTKAMRIERMSMEMGNDMKTRIICSGCKSLLLSSYTYADLSVDHPFVGIAITIQVFCPNCDTITSFEVTNKIQKHFPELAIDLNRFEEKLDAVLEAMPKCNCLEIHVFNQSKQRAEWFCPIHGQIVMRAENIPANF